MGCSSLCLGSAPGLCGGIHNFDGHSVTGTTCSKSIEEKLGTTAGCRGRAPGLCLNFISVNRDILTPCLTFTMTSRKRTIERRI